MAISIDEALTNCLEKMVDQDSSIEDCAGLYPQYEDELVGLLTLIYSLNSLDQIKPRTKFVEHASERLVSKLPDRNISYQEKTRPIRSKRRRKLQFNFGAVRIVAVIVLVMSFFTGGTAFAADYAAPGDVLYGLDLTLEQLQLDLAPNPEASAKIRLEIAAERLEEAENKFVEGDVVNGNVALEAYEREMATLTDLIENEESIDQEKFSELVDSAVTRHEEVLTQLLGKVPTAAKPGIERALEASTKAKKKIPEGPPDNLPKGLLEDKTTGPPEDKEKNKSEGKNKGKPKNTPPGKP